MNALFYNDSILEKYEHESKWDECIAYLFELYLVDVTNKGVFLRLIAQCLYTLVFWDCYMFTKNIEKNAFTKCLEQLYFDAQNHWWSDADCLWLLGYFMCICPAEFTFLFDSLTVESFGNDLICISYSIDPDNELAKVMFLSDNGSAKEYKASLKSISSVIDTYFPSNSLIDKYFVQIFSNSL